MLAPKYGLHAREYMPECYISIKLFCMIMQT